MTAPLIALVARDVCIGYGGKAVVDDITLSIDKQEIVCLLGGSGCGKSTLLRSLAGVYGLQRGSVSFWVHRCSRLICAQRWCSSN